MVFFRRYLRLIRAASVFVGAGVGGDRRQTVEQRLVRDAEGRGALGVGRIEHGAVRQHQPHGGERMIAVGADAAAHARGVVGGDAADLRGVDRGRIGADLAAEGRQAPVGVAADRAKARAGPRRRRRQRRRCESPRRGRSGPNPSPPAPTARCRRRGRSRARRCLRQKPSRAADFLFAFRCHDDARGSAGRNWRRFHRRAGAADR